MHRSCVIFARRTGVLALAAALVVFADTVTAQRVGVTAAPGAQRIEWHDDLPLETDWLYGGRLAWRFGRFVELQPFWYQRDGLGVDSARTSAMFGDSAASRSFDLRHAGASVQVNFGDGGLVPFARGGAGIFRFTPNDGERREYLSLLAGGGLRFDLGGAQAEVFAERLALRLNSSALLTGVEDTAGVRTLQNLTYGAGLIIPLSASDDGTDDRLRGATAPIDLFVGRVEFDDALGLERTDIVGARAGLDFTPAFGLRGFYWQGIGNDTARELAAYGGEAQFNFGGRRGLSPFLVLGAGKLDFSDDFRDTAGVRRPDKNFAILGGGLSWQLSERVRLTGSIRDYVMAVGDELDVVATSDDIVHNRVLSAGLSFALGGSTGARAESERATAGRRGRDMDEPRDDEVRSMRALLEDMRSSDDERDLRALLRELDRRDSLMAVRQDSLSRRRVVSRVEAVSDTVRLMPGDSTAPRVMAPAGAPVGGERWVTVPVPAFGEIILRFGGIGQTTGGQGALRDSAGVPTVIREDGSAARLDALERRLEARFEALQREIERSRAPVVVTPPAAQPVAPLPQVTVVTADDTSAVVVRDRLPVFERFGRARTRDLEPYVGFTVGEDEWFAIGTRVDLGAIRPGSGIRFVPELAVAVGGGDMSVLAFANARYAFSSVAGDTRIRPYVTVGGGVYSPSVLGVNTAVGSSFQLPRAGKDPFFLNLELQGINLFSETRLLFGLSFAR